MLISDMPMTISGGGGGTGDARSGSSVVSRSSELTPLERSSYTASTLPWRSRVLLICATPCRCWRSAIAG